MCSRLWRSLFRFGFLRRGLFGRSCLWCGCRMRSVFCRPCLGRGFCGRFLCRLRMRCWLRRSAGMGSGLNRSSHCRRFRWRLLGRLRMRCGLCRGGRMRSGRRWFFGRRRMSRRSGLARWLIPWRRMRCSRHRMGDIRLRSGGSFGGHRSMLKLSNACSRTRYCGVCRNAMIHRSKVGFILFRNLRMLLLGCSRLQVGPTREGLLLRCRFRGNSIRAAVEAGVSVVDDCRVVDDCLIHVDVRNYGRVHGYCCCVVREGAAAPFAAGKTAAAVAESVVHAAIEADLRPPIAFMECVITSVSPAPVPRCPEIARLRCSDPGARDPIVVANAIPGPIAGCPHEIGLGARWLHVHRKCRRLDVDANADRELCEQARRHRDESSRQESFAEEAHTESFHSKSPI